jgi:putative transposase
LVKWSNTKIFSNLAAKNLALRQQLAVMKRTNKRPNIRMMDRLFWVLLSKIWSSWREALVIAKPDTVVRLHSKGFKLFWKFKSKGLEKPQVSREIRHLVWRMANGQPNSFWKPFPGIRQSI